jgi:hypothetical protein
MSLIAVLANSDRDSPHVGHPNIARSTPKPNGSTRASIIRSPHFGQFGLEIEPGVGFGL